MRDFISELESCVDKSLKLWKKLSHIENGEVVNIVWQFEQSLIIIDVFWKDGDEGVNLQILHPRHRHHYEWSGLSADTIYKVIDRIGNVAQLIMYRKPDAG